MMIRTRDRAMTMIELMLVVTILGILMAVTLPKMSGTNRRAALQTTARDIAKLSAYARQSAISMQADTKLVFDKEQNQWWLELPEDEDNWRRREAKSDEESVHTLNPRILFHEFSRSGEEIHDDPVEVSFRPNGSSTGLVILLATDKNATMTVEIEAATGRAEAYMGEPKTFAEKLEERGVDPSAYAGVTETGGGPVESTPGEGFYRIGQTEEERVSSYADAAARIMGRVRNDYDRQQENEDQRGVPIPRR
ncbi:type II secretion system GspH family protein [bacterium]|nr:type II secretion system GspH family protein [bacterium]